MNIHREVRATLKVREEIHASQGIMTIEQAAGHFNIYKGGRYVLEFLD